MIMPPDLFPPDMQPLIYFTLLPLALIMGLLAVAVAWFIWFPPEAKLYIMNKLRRKDIFDVETESGVRILDTGKIHPDGIAILDKTKLKLLIGRPIPNDKIVGELLKLKKKVTLKEAENAIAKIRAAEKVTLKPSIVKGLGVRIHRVYQSFARATSLATLVGLEYDGQSKTTALAIPVLAKTGKRFSPAKLFIKKDMDSGEWILPVALPADPSVLRSWAHKEVSPIQTDKLFYLGGKYKEEESGNALKKYLPYIIIIGVIVIGAILAIMFLGGGGVQ